MKVEATALAGVLKIMPVRHQDSRGYFSESFREDFFRAEVADVGFVQDNQSFSSHVGTVRGLHFQRPPFAQGKLIGVVAGSILDVAVDVRQESPTFGHWIACVLSQENGLQLWIPQGFAHGFMTLQPNTISHYKVTAPYSASHEGGLLWNDPDLAIDWPLDQTVVRISDRDARQPRLRDLWREEPEPHAEVAV